MALNTFQIMDGATGFTVTGGTAVTFAVSGQVVAGGLNVSNQAVADFKTRPHITFRHRTPTRQPNGTHSKGKMFITYTQPFVKADGTLGYNVERYEKEYDIDASATDLLKNRRSMTQLMFNAALEQFHLVGSVV